ncbi:MULTISPECIES: hypothetical protein [Maribacter]|uniref:Uncharacterized protein n=2 Tax=Maribacter TaxID=252356 RepID=A0A5B2TWJ0_9FLAO|nr:MULTISPECIES: hypothetical protein [Maribacter]KAA2218473.1 hypothetical protein F0361_02290 [Maribacter flavus]MDC6404824.1 hypothetical protein [Maribacter sp. PR66]MEE1972238.1 hypothetical protein [Maribacter flavus]TLF43240.1 hypothetical protein FEK29_14110 [Maribacter aurantiacus]
MKTIDKTKATVLVIGVLTVMVSLIGALKDLNLMNYFFPLYAGLTLVGVSLLNKENIVEIPNKEANV